MKLTLKARRAGQGTAGIVLLRLKSVVASDRLADADEQGLDILDFWHICAMLCNRGEQLMDAAIWRVDPTLWGSMRTGKV